MTVIESGDLLLVGAVALAHARQLGMTSAKIGELRKKHKIPPPRTDGPDEFIRAMRAQQNSLEFGLAFEIVLWTAGIFGHPIPTAIFGALYVYSREKYINGYIKSADERIAPFWLGVRALKGLTAVAVLGLVHVSLKHYVGIDVIDVVKARLF